MKFLPVLTIFFASVLAAPARRSGDNDTFFDPCPTIYGEVKCCNPGVAGFDVNCVNPTPAPTSLDDFKASCASVGKNARCCIDRGVS
ncbi:hypothetical protein FPOAC2_13941 [Fusarium poae]|uniref:Hydrophobin n=1 Tax=Fusarium poae TaxID=36050 RepID=A0A1B8AAU1_FUSPO|nr:uncharacterized protein FPOAC1_013606 [Fusarium poae]KAG8664826.1 hypothetical protein FPOAC1_013606 [Fusarium poae]OBS15239.1 hypothetical protein FPOA_13917 [Fusarium poae]OBS17590.1 hypothetical protein FPOA_11992 [Fusarium poae]